MTSIVRGRQYLFASILCLAALFGQAEKVQAFDAKTLKAVVSVLPVWLTNRAQGGPAPRPGTAPEGSGVVVRPSIVATAWQVVEPATRIPATRIDVRLADGRVLPAKLLAKDVASDIALLELDANLDPIDIAPDVGLADPVCVVGNAYGLGLSVTCGVVSALGVTNAGFNPIEDFIQTDAAANPGVSGGALVSRQGQLVGLMSAIFASDGDTNAGVNFAVSAKLLNRVVEALLATGRVDYQNPGWRLRSATREELAEVAAPFVTDVAADGAAAISGARPGDRILSIGDRGVRTPRDAIAALAILPRDMATVGVSVLRDGETELLELVLSDAHPRPTTQAERPRLGDCTHPDLVCQAQQAVFRISSHDPIGSATRVGPSLLVTNRHVVGDRLEAVVHTADGPRPARVVPSAFEGDLVVLAVEDGLPELGHIPSLDDDWGDQLVFFVVGADIARETVRVFAPGNLIASPTDGADLGRLHVTSRMQPGVSGGALVTEDGKLAGIAVGGGDGRFEALPVEAVRSLLNLRDHAEAVETTRRLGEAFVACESVIGASSGNPRDADVDQLMAVCAAAKNHGQLLEAGRILATSGHFEGAIALHSQAVDQAPNSANAVVSLLVSLQFAGRFEEMTGHARRLMGLIPDDPQILRFAIQSGVWGGEPDLAAAGYQALLKVNPQQAEAARRFIDSAPPRPPRR